ncbi:MAG: aminotransferase class I/II-fold pyridoxal phosphate-dependent enzyme [Bacteroidia bacterium]|nr:aminotransferase class I/II-fold pyridoxal phosphate-dependent enzyme [Bacteroidia bacterium]
MLIIVEGVYSMDGDICPLKEFVELKKKYNAYLMVDEAHSLGVLGAMGHGVDSHYDIPPSEIDIFTGSLSKAVPASGGFVASSKEIIILLQHGSPPYIFSAALTPPATAAALATLKIFESEPQRIKKLWSNTRFFSKELKKLGYDIGFSSTPIIPIILGANEATLSFARKLFDRQILATPIVFPAVPKSQSRLRLCVNAAHEISYLEEVLEIFQKLK